MPPPKALHNRKKTPLEPFGEDLTGGIVGLDVAMHLIVELDGEPQRCSVRQRFVRSHLNLLSGRD